MRVMVTGGRDYKDHRTIRATLDALLAEGMTLLIHGGHWEGLDAYANRWAEDAEVPCLRHPAKWRTGKARRGEGPIRNQAMIDMWKPDLCVAFRGNSGTADCARRARAAGIPVREIA